MRTLCVFLAAFLWIGHIQADTQDKSLVVVIPSYNNKEWYRKNLDSVFSQSYQKFRIIYVDDASPDGTGALVQEYIQKKGQEHRVTLIRNEKRVGALANIYRAVYLCAPDEIVVNLDGDDWLAHRDVFAQLNRVYANRDVWLTYGQFIYYPSFEEGIGVQIPDEIIEQNGFRSFTRGTTALRTFYAGLFHRIKTEDLLYSGEFFRVGYDLAIMLPMLEMAGRHIRFIPEVSYVYNFGTPINDHKINFDEQAAVDHFVRGKERYRPLPHYNQKEASKKVYITPGYWGELFSISNPHVNRDNCLDVLYRLREVAAQAGYKLQQADSLESLDDFEYLVVFEIFPNQIHYLERYPKEKLILFLWEPPTVIPENYNTEHHSLFSKIYTWSDALIDNKKYFKFYYPVFRPMIKDPTDFYWKRLCTLIACNKESSYPHQLYGERKKVIDFFESLPYGDFDLYGKGWPNYYKTYQGPIERKADCLKHYKFCFAYENTRDVPGYVTEKIFDCFHAGAVPVYWGAPNISQYVPKNCFIAREDFQDDWALYDFLKNMSQAQYSEYMKNIQKFLASSAAQLYSTENFIRIFMNLITTPPDKS